MVNVNGNKRVPKESTTGFVEVDRAFVAQMWDDARTARLSDLYYGERLAVLTRVSRWTDMLIAIAASGSGVAGWAVWQFETGKIAWGVIAAIAAILAIAKPLMNLNTQISAFTKQQQIYRGALSSLEFLVFDIQQAEMVKSEHRTRYQRIRDKLMQAESADESTQSEKLREKLQQKVLIEMPARSLWVPPRPAEIAAEAA